MVGSSHCLAGSTPEPQLNIAASNHAYWKWHYILELSEIGNYSTFRDSAASVIIMPRSDTSKPGISLTCGDDLMPDPGSDSLRGGQCLGCDRSMRPADICLRAITIKTAKKMRSLSATLCCSNVRPLRCTGTIPRASRILNVQR